MAECSNSQERPAFDPIAPKAFPQVREEKGEIRARVRDGDREKDRQMFGVRGGKCGSGLLVACNSICALSVMFLRALATHIVLLQGPSNCEEQLQEAEAAPRDILRELRGTSLSSAVYRMLAKCVTVIMPPPLPCRESLWLLACVARALLTTRNLFCSVV